MGADDAKALAPTVSNFHPHDLILILISLFDANGVDFHAPAFAASGVLLDGSWRPAVSL